MPPLEPLPERKMDVMIRVNQGMPYKVVAAEVGISEVRVKQIVRELKDRYGVEKKYELVAAFRLEHPEHIPDASDKIDSVVPEPLDGRKATLYRLLAILAITVLIGIVTFGAIYAGWLIGEILPKGILIGDEVAN